MPVVMHFSTFMKLLTLDVGGKIRQLEKYAKPGGFDFYRPSRQGTYDFSAHGRPKEKVLADITANSAPKAVDRNLQIFEEVTIWLSKQNVTGRILPGRGVWRSPNRVFSVHIEPEIGFSCKDETKIIAVYPGRDPALDRDKAGAGITLLRQAYRGAGNEKFGLLDAARGKAFWTPTNFSQAILDSEIRTIEENMPAI